MSGQSLSAAALSELLRQRVKPRVFVSYHHENDQRWYDEFNRLFSGTYDVVTDRSLDRAVDSDNAEYVERRIRESHIAGTSCTIVLVGAETWKRKYVDWEIHATLYKKHGLLGINLPTNPKQLSGKYTVPSRLHKNIVSGFAGWMQWTNDPAALTAAIDDARNRSSGTTLIVNSDQKMRRNLS